MILCVIVFWVWTRMIDKLLNVLGALEASELVNINSEVPRVLI